jgi:hypothetical protein
MRRPGSEAATVVWLPHFLSDQRRGQLGRLLKMNYLLERNRLADYASHLGADDQVKVRHQLQAQSATLTSQLAAVLQQVYGISGGDEANLGKDLTDEHVLSLWPGVTPRLRGGAGFEQNLFALVDVVLATMYPKHPDFDPTGSRKPITAGDLRAVRGWITEAMETGTRRAVLDKSNLPLARRVVHPLELGEVHDGPLNVSTEWRRRIDQLAAQHDAQGDLLVDDLRRWIDEAGWTGLDKPVVNLIIATYALLADRAWTYRGAVDPNPPDLDRISSTGWALRAQDLPGEEDFTAARQRAAAVFGIKAPEVLFARNVAKLAAEVREKALALESAVNGVRQELDRHSDALGLTSGAPRVVSVRDAADLVARLIGEHDATVLVRSLSGAHYETTDVVLGTAIKSAPQVLAALEAVEWSLLEAVTRFVGRPDALGSQSQRMVAEVATTAAATQYERALEPVLGSVRSRAIALIQEAARLAAVAAPVPSTVSDPGTVPGRDPVAVQSVERGPWPKGAGQISLTESGEPVVPANPVSPATPVPGTAHGGARRLSGSSVETVLSGLVAAVSQEIRDYAMVNPGVEIEISWRPVPADGIAG